VTAVTASMLHAQEAAPASGPVELEAVEITAHLRSEQLQDSPLAVSALQSADLERTGVQDLRALTE
jgi:iron complex outermembrane receptor protein